MPKQGKNCQIDASQVIYNLVVNQASCFAKLQRLTCSSLEPCEYASGILVVGESMVCIKHYAVPKSTKEIIT